MVPVHDVHLLCKTLLTRIKPQVNAQFCCFSVCHLWSRRHRVCIFDPVSRSACFVVVSALLGGPAINSVDPKDVAFGEIGMVGLVGYHHQVVILTG